jgi:cell fate (sporulation/competence/biofilm development) regulator YlbF (YheA/YmcA/DUF963 family)
METLKIYNKVSELAEALTQSELFIEYKTTQVQLLADASFQALLTLFSKKKLEYEEVTQYGSYHPDLERVKKDYQQAKVTLMTHPLFKRYKQVEKELDTLIYRVEEQIQQVVGIKDKHKKSSLKFLY